jgi:hypothetical protein
MDETLCFGKENMSLLEDSQALRVPRMEPKILVLNAVSWDRDLGILIFWLLVLWFERYFDGIHRKRFKFDGTESEDLHENSVTAWILGTLLTFVCREKETKTICVEMVCHSTCKTSSKHSRKQQHSQVPEGFLNVSNIALTTNYMPSHNSMFLYTACNERGKNVCKKSNCNEFWMQCRFWDSHNGSYKSYRLLRYSAM